MVHAPCVGGEMVTSPLRRLRWPLPAGTYTSLATLCSTSDATATARTTLAVASATTSSSGPDRPHSGPWTPRSAHATRRRSRTRCASATRTTWTTRTTDPFPPVLWASVSASLGRAPRVVVDDSDVWTTATTPRRRTPLVQQPLKSSKRHTVGHGLATEAPRAKLLIHVALHEVRTSCAMLCRQRSQYAVMAREAVMMLPPKLGTPIHPKVGQQTSWQAPPALAATPSPPTAERRALRVIHARATGPRACGHRSPVRTTQRGAGKLFGIMCQIIR